jgi:hypothetical protein
MFVLLIAVHRSNAHAVLQAIATGGREAIPHVRITHEGELSLGEVSEVIDIRMTEPAMLRQVIFRTGWGKCAGIGILTPRGKEAPAVLDGALVGSRENLL